MLLDITQDGRTLHVSYFNMNGKTDFMIYTLGEHDMYNWQVCDPNDKDASNVMKNWNGHSVKKTRTKILNKFRLIEYIDNLPWTDKNTIFGYTFPKTYFVDIEVEVTDAFPEPSKAVNPVTTICIVTPDRQCIVLATKDLDKPTQSKYKKRLMNILKI